MLFVEGLILLTMIANITEHCFTTPQMLAGVYLELLGGKEPNLNLDSIDITKKSDLGSFETANVGIIKILSYGVNEKEQKNHSKFIKNLGNKTI